MYINFTHYFPYSTNILHAIPMSALSAKLSPPGMESAVFGKFGFIFMSLHSRFATTNHCYVFSCVAYSVGIGTFCFMFSNLLGSGIIEWSGMITVGDHCDFDNLPYLIVICQILVPLAVGIPATLFIPNVHQTERLIDWKTEQWYEDDKEEELDDTLDSEGSNEILCIEETSLV